METVREGFKKMLVANGMFESQAEQVMQIAVPAINKSMETSPKVVAPVRSKYNRRKRKKLCLGEFAPRVVVEIPVENPYRFTWDAPAKDYPDAIYRVLYVKHVKPIAYKWINDNLPMAWYKPMFA